MARAPHLSIGALLAALLATQAPEAGALPREKDSWIQVDTANFTLYSNASAATAKSVGRDLEQFHALLSRLTAGKMSTPIPTLIYVFDSDRAFTPYKPVQDGKPDELASLFQGREHANYISMNGALARGTSGTVYTMYAFQFLHHNAPGLPLWFRRGLAELYGTAEIGQKHTNVGKTDIGHLRRLRDRPFIQLAELFAAKKHPGYRSGETAYYFDAQCWVVVHYLLMVDPERRRQAFELVNQLMSGVPQDAAFEKVFKTTYAEMQRELTAYVRQPTFGYVRYDLAKIAVEEMRVEPMSYADVLYRLGDLLASQQDLRPEAGEHFQTALKENPQHALALAGLGMLEERQDRHAAALEHYRKAAALAPDDFLVQYRYGVSLLRDGDGSRAADAQRALGLSVAANPGFAPAWAELTYAHTFEDEPSANAVAAAETAHRLLPSRKDVAKNLLLLYTRAGLRQQAQALIDGFFLRQATPEELAEARVRLAYLDLEAAYDLLRDGKTEKAHDLWETLKAVPTAGASGLRIAEQIRNLGRDIEDRRLSQRYNEAVDRYNAGDFAAVAGLLEDVLASSRDARLTEQARALVEAARKRLSGGGGR